MSSRAACSSSPSFFRRWSPPAVDRCIITSLPNSNNLCFKESPSFGLFLLVWFFFLFFTVLFFFLFLIPHALHNDYIITQTKEIRSDRTGSNKKSRVRLRRGRVLTLGPVGPLRQRGVLLVPQMAQLFLFSLLILPPPSLLLLISSVVNLVFIMASESKI